MREFVVVSHTGPLEAGFSLDDLPGGAGRLDVLCRCVNAAFMVSHGIRENVQLRLVIQDAVTIRLVGSELRYVSPDERNIASLLRSALAARESVVGEMEVESSPGIYVSNQGVESVVDAVAGVRVVQLHEDGDPIQSLNPSDEFAFVLSDHEEFATREAEVLLEAGAVRVSVGPLAIHADHAITVVQNYLDTGRFQGYEIDS